MAEKLTEADVRARIAQLHGWSVVLVGDAQAIEKTFTTGDFLSGLAFLTKVAVLAEKANHHPDVTLTYPRLGITLTTHDAGGITEKDFALAARIDALS